MVRPIAQGFWDDFIADMKARGIAVNDYRKRDPKTGQFVKGYSRSSSADKTFGFHDSINTPGNAAPTNPALRRYDAVFGSFDGKPWVNINRFADQRRGSVANRNRDAGIQVAWGGNNGGTPTGQEAEIGRLMVKYLQEAQPDWKMSGHGELYNHNHGYSVAGREPDEGQWRTAVMQDAILPIAAQHQPPAPGRPQMQLASGPSPAMRPPMALGGPQAESLPPVDVPQGPQPVASVGPPSALSPVGPTETIQARSPNDATVLNPGSVPPPPAVSQAQSVGVSASPPLPARNPAPQPPPPPQTPQPQGQTWSQAMHQQMMGGPMMMPGQTFAPTPKNNALIGLLGGWF